MNRMWMLIAAVAAFATVAAQTAAAAGLACGAVLAPGTYRLTDDLNCSQLPVGVPALVTTSDGGVTLDLGGYSIKGPGASTGSIGIRITGGPGSLLPNLTLSNGTIREFGTGVYGMDGRFDATNVRITRDGTGINGTLALRSTLHDSVVADNVGDGIAAGVDAYAHIFDSRITGNGGSGINLHEASLRVERSVISRNGGYGIYEDFWGVYLSENTVDANGRDGIFLGMNPFPDLYTLLNNSVDRNGGHGIVYQPEWSTIEHTLIADGNTASRNETAQDCVNIECDVK